MRVGWYEGGYNITGPSGERSGYGYEFQQTVAGYTGWRYEYVKGNSMELLEKLQRGELDMLNCISYTPERAQHVLFSAENNIIFMPIWIRRAFLPRSCTCWRASASA